MSSPLRRREGWAKLDSLAPWYLVALQILISTGTYLRTRLANPAHEHATPLAWTLSQAEAVVEKMHVTLALNMTLREEVLVEKCLGGCHPGSEHDAAGGGAGGKVPRWVAGSGGEDARHPGSEHDAAGGGAGGKVPRWVAGSAAATSRRLR